MPIVQIDNVEISAIATFAAAHPPAGPVINGFLLRMQAASVVAVKSAIKDLFSAGVEGVIYQSQVDAALLIGVPQATINKILVATVVTVTPNPP